MTDPEYVFVKGEGWVVKPPVGFVVIYTSHGRYTIIDSARRVLWYVFQD